MVGQGAVAVFTSLVLGLASASCAPGTPDRDSWRVDARYAVSDVSAAVQSARLALEHADDLFGPYLQTVLVDAEKAAGTSSDAFAATQAPVGEHTRYGRVTDELDRASSLLARARMAVVDRDASAYPVLARRLGGEARRLDDLKGQLEHPGRTP